MMYIAILKKTILIDGHLTHVIGPFASVDALKAWAVAYEEANPPVFLEVMIDVIHTPPLAERLPVSGR